MESLSTKDPDRLEAFRREYEKLVETFLEDNVVHQDFLLTRATKV